MDNALPAVGGQVCPLMRGRELITTFDSGFQTESGFQTSTDGFYQQAIPYGYDLLRDQPWEQEQFRHLRSRSNPKENFLKFLRAAFKLGRKQKTAEQQAYIIAMICEAGLTYEDVKGVYFRFLLELSYVKHISEQEFRQLLALAKTCETTEEYEPAIGAQLDPQLPLNLKASRTACQILRDFDQSTFATDNRPLMDRVTDVLNAAMYTEHPGYMLACRMTQIFCNYQRRREESLSRMSAPLLLGNMHYMALELAREDLDEVTLAEFEAAVGLRQEGGTSGE